MSDISSIIYVKFKDAIEVMAVKEGKENVKRWRRKKVSEKGCDRNIQAREKYKSHLEINQG